MLDIQILSDTNILFLNEEINIITHPPPQTAGTHKKILDPPLTSTTRMMKIPDTNTSKIFLRSRIAPIYEPILGVKCTVLYVGVLSLIH